MAIHMYPDSHGARKARHLLTTSGKYLEVSGDDIQARTLCGRCPALRGPYGRFLEHVKMGGSTSLDVNTKKVSHDLKVNPI